MWHRPEQKQNPLAMWLITIACCVVALAVGMIVIGRLI